MKKMARVVMVAVVLAALTIGQSAVFAAPTRGVQTAAAHAKGSGLFAHILSSLAAVWNHSSSLRDGGNRPVSPDTAIWGGH
jgi:hypothetical protein